MTAPELGQNLCVATQRGQCFRRRELWVTLAVVFAVLLVFVTFEALVGPLKQKWAIATMRGSVDYETNGPLWLENLIGKDFTGHVVQVYQDGMWFDDAHLAYVKSLPKLKRLMLLGTSVTDDGLAHLTELNQLEELGLENTQVTDAGLVHLKKMTNLKRLILIGTQVSEKGAENLQRDLPACRIELTWPTKDRKKK